MARDEPRVLKVWNWLKEPRLAWWTIGVLAASVAIAILHGEARSYLYAGLLLQMLGIGTTAWAVRNTALFYKEPGTLAYMRDWLDRFPLRRRPARIVSGTAFAAGSSDASFGSQLVMQHAPRGADLPERVEMLEKHLMNLSEHVGKTSATLSKRLDNVEGKIEEERHTRTTEVRQVRGEVRETQVGNLSLARMGVLWVFAGTLMTTASEALSVRLRF